VVRSSSCGASAAGCGGGGRNDGGAAQRASSLPVVSPLRRTPTRAADAGSSEQQL
jgi:hypothetical protein